ncbi:MAG: thermonuclease family protein [Thalassobaculum sp.]|uniref:thermonuclease family protein n=1 Tax=Thalassobaculum sp. TaxID=2022740 RepID=UPI0032EC2DE6
MRPVRVFVAVFVLAAGILSVAPPASAEVKGRPRVLSGDMLQIGRETVRLYGIDAPEQDQYCENEYGRPFECGIQALDALTELVGRRTVTCVGDRRNDEGHLLAVCYAGDMNLNSRMVRTGWAVARADEQPDFASMERLARGERAGIWSLKFVDPAEWRKQNP